MSPNGFKIRQSLRIISEFFDVNINIWPKDGSLCIKNVKNCGMCGMCHVYWKNS